MKLSLNELDFSKPKGEEIAAVLFEMIVEGTLNAVQHQLKDDPEDYQGNIFALAMSVLDKHLDDSGKKLLNAAGKRLGVYK